MLKEIIVGSLTGLAFGFFIGVIKYFLIWKPVLKDTGMDAAKASAYVIRYGIRFFLSILFDLAALFIVYFSRNYLPWAYLYVLIGTALSLSVSGLLLNKAVNTHEARIAKHN